MISFLMALFTSISFASMSPMAMIHGKVIIVDMDKIVITQPNKRIEIPAKYVKEKYKVGDEATVNVPDSDLKNLRVETTHKK